MIDTSTVSKALRARELGIYRGVFYYRKKKIEQDWQSKCQIEGILRQKGKHAYGSRRLAWHLKLNRKRIQRVMRLFGIKPYRRRSWKPKKKAIKIEYPNRLLTNMPLWRCHIWAADFTEIAWFKKKLYLATVIDLYTREIVGLAVSKNKGVQLTAVALWNALIYNPKPMIFHSDNGSEYRAIAFVEILKNLNILISRSAPGCPWENGYQESFNDKWKVDFGDPNRYQSFGELISEIYHSIWIYNNERIHSSLKMVPVEFAQKTIAA
ncbi:MAG: IS3 family transposase [Verrucomicrobiales bacterium]|nr:IS3 family transposase [Verrucomicrobiales bacterium]